LSDQFLYFQNDIIDRRKAWGLPGDKSERRSRYLLSTSGLLCFRIIKVVNID